MKRLFAIVALLLCGCATSKSFYSSVMGEERVIGVALPQASSINISAYQTFEGNKATVRDPANIYHRYRESSSNSVFGVVNWTKTKDHEIYICATNQVLNLK